MKFPIITRVLLFWVIGIAATAVLGGLASQHKAVRLWIIHAAFLDSPGSLGLGGTRQHLPTWTPRRKSFLWSRFFRCLSPTSGTDERGSSKLASPSRGS